MEETPDLGEVSDTHSPDKDVKVISRELKSLIDSAKDSKIINECTQVTNKMRKSRIENFEASLLQSEKDSRSRASSTASNSSASEQSSKHQKEKRSMRSQNQDFVIKQQKFLKSVSGKVAMLNNSCVEEKTKASPVNDVKRMARAKSEGRTVEMKSINEESTKEKVFSNGRVTDTFCWRCHGASATLHCSQCPRSYHSRCGTTRNVLPQDIWVCPECCKTTNADNIDNRPASMRKVSLSRLNTLFRFALRRMENVKGAEPFLLPVDPEQFSDYLRYVVHPMDLTLLKEKTMTNSYGSQKGFVRDVEWIVHNSHIYNTNQSKLTSVARSLLKVCHQEMTEIETCPECYYNANTKEKWFVQVCEKPHILLWAKLKTFPFWPAKGMMSQAGMVDVRFFGQHDRAWVRAQDCYLFSLKDPNYNNKIKKAEIAKALEEVNLHIAKIISKFDVFNYASFKTPYLPDQEEEQLRMMIPKFNSLNNDSGAPSVVHISNPQISRVPTASQKIDKLIETITHMQPRVVLDTSSVMMNQNYESEDEDMNDEDLNLTGDNLQIKQLYSADELKQIIAGNSKPTDSPTDTENTSIQNVVNISSSSDDKSPFADRPRKRKRRTLSETQSFVKKQKTDEKDPGADENQTEFASMRNRRKSLDSKLMKEYKAALAKKACATFADSRTTPDKDVELNHNNNNAEKENSVTKVTQIPNNSPAKSKATNETSPSPRTPVKKNPTSLVNKSNKQSNILTLDKTSLKDGVQTTENSTGGNTGTENTPNKTVQPNNGLETIKVTNIMSLASGSKYNSNETKESETAPPGAKKIDIIRAMSLSSNKPTNIIKTSPKLVNTNKPTPNMALKSLVNKAQTTFGKEVVLKTVPISVNNSTTQSINITNNVSTNAITSQKITSVNSKPNKVVEADPRSNSPKTQMRLRISSPSEINQISFASVNTLPVGSAKDTSPTTTDLTNDSVLEDPLFLADEPVRIKEEPMDCEEIAEKEKSNSTDRTLLFNSLHLQPNEATKNTTVSTNGRQSTVKQTSNQNKPQNVQKEPQNIQNKPQTVQKEPQNAQKEPQTVEKEPQTVQKEPQNVQKEPQTVQKEPQTVQKEPQNGQARASPVSQKEPNKDLKKKSSPVKIAKGEVKRYKSAAEIRDEKTIKIVSNSFLMNRDVLYKTINTNNKDPQNQPKIICQKKTVSGNKITISNPEVESLLINSLSPITSKSLTVASDKSSNMVYIPMQIIDLNKDNTQTSQSNTVTSNSLMKNVKIGPQVGFKNSGTLTSGCLTSVGNFIPQVKRIQPVQKILTPVMSITNGTLDNPMTLASPIALQDGNTTANNTDTNVGQINFLQNIAFKSTPSTIGPRQFQVLSLLSPGQTSDGASTETASGTLPTAPTPTPASSTQTSSAPMMFQSTTPFDSTMSMDTTIPPGTAGPHHAILNDNAFKMTEYFRHLLDSSIQSVAIQGSPKAMVLSLQMQIERLKWQMTARIKEIRDQTEAVIAENCAMFERKAERAINEVKRQAEIDKLNAINEVKKKQWCAVCGKESQFFCCWRTSYCDYPCQQAHWSQHMNKCTQPSKDSEDEEDDSTTTITTKTTTATPTISSVVSPTSAKKKRIIIARTGLVSSSGITMPSVQTNKSPNIQSNNTILSPGPVNSPASTSS